MGRSLKSLKGAVSIASGLGHALLARARGGVWFSRAAGHVQQAAAEVSSLILVCMGKKEGKG